MQNTAEKLIRLITQSQALPSKLKEDFLSKTKTLSEEKLLQLIKILESEENGTSQIKDKYQKKEAATNAEFAEKLETNFKQNLKLSISKEEAEEKAKAEQVLKLLEENA